MEKPKLSKCIITGGKELLKELGIDFQDMEIERADRISETLTKKEGEEKNGNDDRNIQRKN